MPRRIVGREGVRRVSARWRSADWDALGDGRVDKSVVVAVAITVLVDVIVVSILSCDGLVYDAAVFGGCWGG